MTPRRWRAGPDRFIKTLCLRRLGAWLFGGAEGVKVPSDEAKVHQRDSSHFKLDFETPRRNAPTQAKIYAEFYLSAERS